MDSNAMAQDARGECSILIVDDEPAIVHEYVEIADSLGYSCSFTYDARTALRMVATQPDIGIIVTDVQMPELDGLTLLDELSARFSALRPIVAVVATGYGSFDAAIQAMRYNAVDFLSKPVSREQFAAALRRASARWAQLAAKAPPVSVEPENDETSPANGAESAQQLAEHIRRVLRNRQKRQDFIEPTLISDAAWDILLDLTSARLEGAPVAVSSACAATGAPLSTALRHVRNLVDAKLVRRWQDPNDRRRDLLELTDEAMSVMTAYFAATGRALG